MTDTKPAERLGEETVKACPFCGKTADLIGDEARCSLHGGWGRLHLKIEDWDMRPQFMRRRRVA